MINPKNVHYGLARLTYYYASLSQATMYPLPLHVFDPGSGSFRTPSSSPKPRGGSGVSFRVREQDTPKTK